MPANQGTWPLAAIVLAAGRSRRMVRGHKLLLPWQGASLIQHALRTVMSQAWLQVLLVTGTQETLIRRELAAWQSLTLVHNPQPQSGLASSIHLALPHLLPVKGLFFFQADMPLVQARTVALLCATLATASTGAMVVPTFQGRRGNPVGFGIDWVQALSELEGDKGGRCLLRDHPDNVLEVAVADPGIHQDIDCDRDYLWLLNR